MAKKEETVHPVIQQPEMHKYYIDTVLGVRFDTNDECVPHRFVTKIDVMSDRDLANEPDEKARLVEEAKDRLEAEGWELTDSRAEHRTHAIIEEALSELAHKIRYGHKCQECAAARVAELAGMMRVIRLHRKERSRCVTKNKFCPAVLPPNWEDDYHVEKSVLGINPETKRPVYKTDLVPNAPRVKEVHSVPVDFSKLPKEASDALKGLIDKGLIPNILDKPKAIEAKKEAPAPAKPKKVVKKAPAKK